MLQADPKILAQFIKTHIPRYATPTVGIVLGSGLGEFAHQLENPISIPYEKLPGFPIPTVQGHHGNLVVGFCGDVCVVCLQGRAHGYEGVSATVVKTYVRTLKQLGCEYFLATNAVGSMREDLAPGELVLITDHINLQTSNPLTGPNEDEYGPRFLAVDNAYNQDVRESLLSIAREHNIRLTEGIYTAVSGPNFETAAEIRAFRILGGDVVGMSTVPEVLVAHHCNMKVAVISIVTNFATGLAQVAHDHADVIKTAQGSAVNLERLLRNWIKNM